MRNADVQKSPILQWWGKWKSDPESVSGTRSPPKVNEFFRLVYHDTKFQWICLITFAVILLTEWQTGWQTNCVDCVTSVLVEVIIVARIQRCFAKWSTGSCHQEIKLSSTTSTITVLWWFLALYGVCILTITVELSLFWKTWIHLNTRHNVSLAEHRPLSKNRWSV